MHFFRKTSSLGEYKVLGGDAAILVSISMFDN